jgi:gentisate 1,2-dioxygenase
MTAAPAYVQPLDALARARRADLGVVTHRWRYRDLRRLSEALGGPLALVNPGLGETTRTTRTLTCTVTHLEPGSRTRTPRTASGIRIVLDGEAAFTVAGSRLTLARGDVIRTQDAGAADWQAGDEGALWLDAIDLPLVSAISPESLEGAEHARCRRAPRRSRCGPEHRPACLPPPVIHRWAKTGAVLADAVAEGSVLGIARFGTPKRGGDLTAALRAEVHRLEPGRRSPSVRANQSAVMVVLSGTGTSVVGGWRVPWEPGDVLVAPPGAPVDHHADAVSDLLVISDAPALEALGLWWSETEPEHQPIEGALD